MQTKLFEPKIEIEKVDYIIGSGYELKIAELALIDGVAYRAARKNMQKNSAIILKIDGEFSGFFTYEINHNVGEFCLLQSAMYESKKDEAIYGLMVKKIIEQNTFGYPMIMTVSRKHDLEKPSVFHELGFETYFVASDFEYIVYGKLSDIRLKLLCHIAMTNVWRSTSGPWLKIKKEWNEKIEIAGNKYGVENPKYATREGGWQGDSGFANVVLSKQKVENEEIITDNKKTLNHNVSVLDPVVCEIILKMFMPRNGKIIYNPFAGGVQMGFIAGEYGFEYVGSEIRQNQCDANNLICKDFKNVKWIKSDSSKFVPDFKSDLVFACPPYYKVEKYIDYNNIIPEGELNSLKSFNEFEKLLFEGYKNAILSMNENTFFVVMVGDSRDKYGNYYGVEASHEIFFKNQGMVIYNKIIYLEPEFTRRAQAKKTLDYRKYPKCEQKILIFYKGDVKKIKESYQPIGRL